MIFIYSEDHVSHKQISRMAGYCVLILFFSFLAHPAFAQSDSMTLSSASGAAGSSVSLNLTLNSASGNQPAAIQWTLSYNSSSVSAISATAGTSAATAGDAIVCMN